jgi:hypothetical protein
MHANSAHETSRVAPVFAFFADAILNYTLSGGGTGT